MNSRDKDKLRVLLVNEPTIKQEGYDNLLQRQGKFLVVGEATTAARAVELAEENLPDIVLIDCASTEGKSLEIIKRLKHTQLTATIIVLSYQTEERFITQTLQAGASGYIIKTNIGQELAQAVSKIELGQIYLSPLVPKSLIKDHQYLSRDYEEPLTERQREILKFLARGYTNKQIAKQFNLSVKTVDAHRANIMNKLKIHDLPGLVKYAIRTGLTTIEE